LSYSTFAYNKIWINETAAKDTLSLQATAERFSGQKAGESLYDVLFTVYAEIENSGKVFGCEVAQLVSQSHWRLRLASSTDLLHSRFVSLSLGLQYVEFPSVEGQPPRNMRGFDKVKHLEAGDKRTATFP
jgi:beta-glucosidase